MIIETLQSTTGKVAELRSGVNGSGNAVYCLQWLRSGACYHIDTFATEAEARAYFAATA